MSETRVVSTARSYVMELIIISIRKTTNFSNSRRSHYKWYITPWNEGSRAKQFGEQLLLLAGYLKYPSWCWSRAAEGNGRMKAKGLAKGAGLSDETSFRERKSGSVGEPDPVRSTGDILLVYEPSPWVTEPQHLSRSSILLQERYKVRNEAGKER